MNEEIEEKKTVETDEIIDMNQAVKLLETTRSTFYRWLRSGKIKGMKIGRQWRFYREDILAILSSQRESKPDGGFTFNRRAADAGARSSSNTGTEIASG